MVFIWDYDVNELKKTEEGRIKILERMINYGPGKEKIKLEDVKKYWGKLKLKTKQKHLMELLIWGKSITPINKNYKYLQDILEMDKDDYFVFCIKNGPEKVMKLRLLLEE